MAALGAGVLGVEVLFVSAIILFEFKTHIAVSTVIALGETVAGDVIAVICAVELGCDATSAVMRLISAGDGET